MIRGIYLSYNDDLSQVHAIRNEVFSKELKLTDSQPDDEDIMAVHALLEAEGQGMVATGRMKFDGETFILDKVAVLKEHRHNGYADFVVRMLLDKVFMSQGKVIYANVIKDTIPFFETIGFVANGEDYTDNGIVYTPMKVEYGKVKTQCGGHCN